MTDTKQFSIQLNRESQRQIARLSKMEVAGGKTSAIIRQALSTLYRQELRRPRTFYLTGRNGTLLELFDGRYADTVGGDTSENTDAHKALDVLRFESIDWDDSPIPLLTDMTPQELEEYVGR